MIDNEISVVTDSPSIYIERCTKGIRNAYGS